MSGQETTLYWEIAGEYDALVLEPGDVDVFGETDYTVSPKGATKYTLVAY